MSKKLEPENLIRHINAKELSQLACHLIGIPSPTGHEREVAEFILHWFRSNGIDTIRQEVGPDRLNAVGLVKGSGGGLSLMFNGHMDTTQTGVPDDLLIMGVTKTDWRPTAEIKGGMIVGPGAFNAKGPIAAFMMAAKAIKESGIKLKGDLILAAVSGEIERAPIGPYQGPAYWGGGHGTAFLLSHGVTSDYALVAEPTGFGIAWVLPGAVYAKITAYGEGVYAPYVRRAARPEESPNAVVKMIKIAEAIEVWGEEYEKKNRREFEGRVMIPKVNIGAIMGGLPFKPNYSAAQCSLYVDVRIPPGKDPLEVKTELDRVIKGAGAEAEVSLFRSQRGYQGKGNTLLIESLTQSFLEVLKKKPKATLPPYNSCWNDLNVYHEKGIPGVKFGPPSGREPGEAVKIEDLTNLTKIYALTAANMCTRDRP